MGEKDDTRIVTAVVNCAVQLLCHSVADTAMLHAQPATPATFAALQPCWHSLHALATTRVLHSDFRVHADVSVFHACVLRVHTCRQVVKG